MTLPPIPPVTPTPVPAPKGVTLKQVEAAAGRALGIAAIVVGALATNSTLPASVRATLVGIGGVILAVERYLTGSNAGGS